MLMRPLVVSTTAFLLLQAAACSARTFSSDIPSPMATATTPEVLTTTTAATTTTLTIPFETSLGIAISSRGGDDQVSAGEPVPLMTKSALVRTGCLLAANSGFLNGLALGGKLVTKDGEAVKQAVAAVTGAWTTSALATSTNSYGIIRTQMSVMACYFGGSVINGLMNPSAAIDWNSPSAKAPASALLVSAALVLATYEYISRSTAESISPLILWCLLALANGVQNSWTSMLIQGNILRTAHFSGITSDMGSFVGQILRGGNQNAWKLPIFAALAASFWSGSALSVLCADKYGGVNCLGISVAIYLALYGFYSSFNSKRYKSGIGLSK